MNPHRITLFSCQFVYFFCFRCSYCLTSCFNISTQWVLCYRQASTVMSLYVMVSSIISSYNCSNSNSNSSTISRLHRTHKNVIAKQGPAYRKIRINSLNLFTFRNGFRSNWNLRGSNFIAFKIPVRAAVHRLFWNVRTLYYLMFVAYQIFGEHCLLFFNAQRTTCTVHTHSIWVILRCAEFSGCCQNGWTFSLYDAFRLSWCANNFIIGILYIVFVIWNCINDGYTLYVQFGTMNSTQSQMLTKIYKY